MKEFSTMSYMLKGSVGATVDTESLTKVALKLSKLEECKSPPKSSSYSLSNFSFFKDFFFYF